MKLNENISLTTEQFTLVPYKKKHVEKYHEWMKDVELQEQTASEPLTLEKEYEMQESWHVDEDKLTFIILNNEESESEVERMIGDVNLFISTEDPFADPDDVTSENKKNSVKIGECEIMIAEKAHRGKGLSKGIMSMCIEYAMQNDISSKFIAKIGYENVASQNLFKKLGFVEESRAECFKEITYALDDFESLQIPRYSCEWIG
jgi:RimJ/RimL family protein N-acetyltransferase